MKFNKNQKRLFLQKVTVDTLNGEWIQKVRGGMPPVTIYTQCADISCDVVGGCGNTGRRTRCRCKR